MKDVDVEWVGRAFDVVKECQAIFEVLANVRLALWFQTSNSKIPGSVHISFHAVITAW